MANQTWVQLANAYKPSGTTKGEVYKESTSLKDISPGAATTAALAIPANELNAGSIIRFTAAGIISNTSTPKLVMGLYWGGVSAALPLAKEEVETVTGLSNTCWYLDATSRVESVGTSGKILTIGSIMGIEAKSGLSTSAGTTIIPSSSSSGGEQTINTTESKIVTLGAEWKTSSASNSITVYQWLVEILN